MVANAWGQEAAVGEECRDLHATGNCRTLGATIPDAQRPSGQTTFNQSKEDSQDRERLKHLSCSAVRPCKFALHLPEQGEKHRKTNGFILNDCLKWEEITFKW